MPLKIGIWRALKVKASIDMTFDLAHVKCSFICIGPSTGFRQGWQTLNSSNKLNTKLFAIIYTFIIHIHLGLLFLRDLGNGKKEFGSLDP